jgi:hypothetical protein
VCVCERERERERECVCVRERESVYYQTAEASVALMWSLASRAMRYIHTQKHRQNTHTHSLSL